MDRTRLFIKNFNVRMLLMRILLNMLALLLTVLLIPNIYFVDKRLAVWLAMSLALGILNAVVKPVIQVLTLRFIFATAGLVLVLINAALLAILGWLFPQYIEIGGLLAALLGGAVLGFSAAFFESLLGLSQPIVSEKYPEIRERVRDRQFYRTQAELMRLDAQKGGLARELAVTKVVMAGTHKPVAALVKPVEQASPSAVPAAPALAETDANKVDVAATEADGETADAGAPAAASSKQQEAA